MDGPLISIIVPIYKVEKYLNKCIESLVDQTYKNLEIILVDDGSPDNCPAMCDEWKLKDSRIVVIHKPNGGLSDARNAGLNIAKGEYIGFVDSDDYVSSDMYSQLLKASMRYDFDIVQCEKVDVLEDQDIDYISNDIKECISFSREESLRSLINEKPIKQVVWNKLYKRYIFDDLRFEVGKLNEDDFFTYQALHKCNKVGYIDSILYYYLIRSTSIMGSSFSIKRLDGLEARFRRYNFLKENYINLASEDKKILWFYIIYVYQKILRMDSKEDKEKAKKIVVNFFNIIKNDRVLMKVNSKELMWMFCSRYCLNITCCFRNKMNINIH